LEKTPEADEFQISKEGRRIFEERLNLNLDIEYD